MYWQVPHTNVRLLGSMHLLPANNSGLPSWAIDAFAWAEVLVLEHHPSTILPLLSASTPSNLRRDLTPGAWEALRGLWPTTGHAGYAVSQRKRKRIEQCFGWGKTIGPIRQVMVQGLEKVDQLLTLTMATYNLTRLRSLAALRPQSA